MVITQMTRFKSDESEEMIKNVKAGAEWLPVSIAPSDGDLEFCVIDYDGIIHALLYPCHKNGAEWVDASNKRHLDIQPTHWRKWTESH
jgi:hypothetical protein